jgi:GTPase SAR1 family protein
MQDIKIVIHGQSKSGKSTIAEAIRKCLSETLGDDAVSVLEVGGDPPWEKSLDNLVGKVNVTIKMVNYKNKFGDETDLAGTM